MTSSDTSPPASTSFLQELYLGRVRWDLLRPFPEQDPEDRRAGDEAVARLSRLLLDRVDPAAVETDGRLPEGFLGALQDSGLLSLMIDPSLGGLGLSWLNACRVVETAASWSMPVAFALAVHNGFGSGVYLRALPPGPLRDLISERIAAGVVSGTADAEVAGAGNRGRTTVAVPVDGGDAYLISGEKVFIGNGSVAELVDVSATVVGDDGTEEVRLFFVDTRSPGFEVVSTHEFMGLRGAAFGMLRLDRVRVPAEQLMPEESGGWRMRPEPSGSSGSSGSETAAGESATGGVASEGENAIGEAASGGGTVAGEAPGEASGAAAGAAAGKTAGDLVDDLVDLGELALFGRHLVIAPPALAVARASLLWSRDFVNRRRINDRALGEYEEIRRRVAENAAEVFLIESLLVWCLLGRERADTRPDLTAAKNLVALASWRAVDGTMALLGGEGYETARSKAARGAPPLPVERCFRDARGLRVAGGVEFMLDLWSAEANLRPYYEPGGGAEPAPEPEPGANPRPSRPGGPLERGAGWPRHEPGEPGGPSEGGAEPETDPRPSGPGAPPGGGAGTAGPFPFPPRYRDHLRRLTAQVDRLAGHCRVMTGDVPMDELLTRQRSLALVGRIAAELFGLSVVLARSADLAEAEQGNTAVLDLADVACAACEHRLDGLWSQLARETGRSGAETDPATLGDTWLRGTGLDFLISGAAAPSGPSGSLYDHWSQP
ncbi:acyl-CoA dehydrogenase family protein [Streptosporangium sp. NPDC002524]|uniref:acyl-CoA dehydrogenase family protein n=1 Tax=Streptosporangium sp. NPDC002524 TaxID=3154537 RepID=UPI0033249F9C